MTDPVFFVVTSFGFSGSKWLGATLDRHPKILCTHSALDFRIWDRHYDGDELEACAEEEWKHRLNQPLDDYFDNLAGMGSADVYGNVHRYRLTDLARIYQKWPPKRRFQIANLVRHPVTWVESGAHHIRHLAETSLFNRYEALHSAMNELDYYRDLKRKHGIDLLDWDILCFLAVCQFMSVLIADLNAVSGVRYVQMERVTTDRKLFSEIFRGLTAGRIEASEDYLDEVFEMESVNRHRPGSARRRLTPEEQFAAWAPWQQEAYLHFQDAYGVRRAYEQLGYVFPDWKQEIAV